MFAQGFGFFGRGGLARGVAAATRSSGSAAVWRLGARQHSLLGGLARASSALNPRQSPCLARPQLLAPRASASLSSSADLGPLALNNLRPNPGAHKAARRVGRGRGGGRGKTSGRGNKGAGARKGNSIPYAGFAGGQAPLHRRIPKRGFRNTRFERVYAELNLEKLAKTIRANRLEVSPDREITLKDLSDSGAVSISMHHCGVKLLGQGAEGFDIPIRIAVSAASASAIAAVERAGGSIRTVFHDRLGLRATLTPHKFAVLPRPAYPPPRLMARYMDAERRGYLAHLRNTPAQQQA